MVREHLQLIVENDFLIDRRKHFGDVKYLVEIQDDIEDDLIDKVAQHLNSLESKIDERDHKSDQDMRELKEMIKTQAIQINQLKSTIQNVSDTLTGKNQSPQRKLTISSDQRVKESEIDIDE